MPLSGSSFPRPSSISTYHPETYPRISPKNSGFDGRGKTVLVTGGAEGIGYSICRAFAEAGVAKIMILSRSQKSQQEAKQALSTSYPEVKVETIQASVDNLGAVTKILQDAGPIDVLVLNAVYSHQHNVPSKTIPASEVAKTFEVNVIAPYHMISVYIGSCPKPAGGEKIVLAVSSAGAHLYVPQQAGYGASKAALSRIISAFADEHSPQKDGVRLVSFHPGIVYTESAAKNTPREAFEWEDDKLPGDYAVWLAGRESEFLHGRFVWAEWDVDDLIALKGKVEEDPSFLKIGLVY